MKEWREKKYVFGYFYLIWKDKNPLPTYPKEKGSKPM